MQNIPWNKAWANTTLDVLYQSLENFGFKALYHSTGPPYTVQLDIMGELQNTMDLVENDFFATDLDFQEYVQAIFQSTLDAHTRYQKPACYNAVFIQPFAFDMRVVENVSSIANEPKVFLMKNLYTDTYPNYIPGVDVASLIDKEVVLLNGLELTTAVAAWGDTHETRSNNPGIRFNSAIRSYLYRNAMSLNILPISDLVLTFADGSTATIPWLVSFSTGFGDSTYCAAPPTSQSLQSKTHSFHHDHLELDPHLDQPPVQLKTAVLEESRPDREIIVDTNPYYVSCFIQTMSTKNSSVADVSRVLVMKVSSFSPPGEYLDAWTQFLEYAGYCLSVDYDMVVVDVMQNGGGYVCLGLRLIEMLVEEYNLDHTKVQMNYDLPHSPLMDTYIDVVNAPNPYPDPAEVEQILDRLTQKPFPDGKAYYYPGRNVTQGGVTSWRTNWFSLDCTEAEVLPANGWKPSKYMPPEKLIILTDGTCGSTCASFTKIPQEHGKATFVGAGGLWDQSMDVSSFAGGFVCNPDLLWNIANWSGVSFPKFATKQRWQFGWAAWYSAKLPTRPVQFTSQDPDYREAFWGFPHSSIDPTVTTEMVSSLYDRVIDSTINRLAGDVVTTKSCSDSNGYSGREKTLLGFTITFAILIAVLIGVVIWSFKEKSSTGLAEPLVKQNV